MFSEGIFLACQYLEKKIRSQNMILVIFQILTGKLRLTYV